MFWISKLTVTGSGKTPSVITFEKGLNLIHGPSNTGKTHIISCIDYVFGSSSLPFATNLGYDTVSLIINSDKGNVSIKRKINDKDIEVISQHSDIKTGKYTLSGRQILGNVFLRLLGISEVPSVISSQEYKTQRLSWRNILHMCLVSEERIIRKQSVLLPDQRTGDTPTITTLTYLATGNDFKGVIPKEPLSIVKAKKDAVEHFIRNEIEQIAERQRELHETEQQFDAMEFDNEVDKITHDLLDTQSKISDALKSNQSVLGSITNLNEKLAECTMMSQRYSDLRSQYTSDLDRLNFIVDTAINGSTEHTRNCPFCSSTVKIQDSSEYITAAQAEYKKISLQLLDLEKAIISINNECSSIEQELASAMQQYQNTQDIIEKDLQPYAEELKTKLRDYRNYIKISAEITALNNQSIRMTTKVAEIANEDDSSLLFKAKEHLPQEMIDWINTWWKQSLQHCGFDNVQSVFFDKRIMDIVINGQNKFDFGKGYRAYLNTLNALGVLLYLKEYGKYSPPMLILDSPILSLKEREQNEELVSSPMRAGLFNELKSNQDQLQIIVVENEIPPIDYTNVNIIEFTKSKDYGRYGFLMDVVN